MTVLGVAGDVVRTGERGVFEGILLKVGGFFLWKLRILWNVDIWMLMIV